MKRMKLPFIYAIDTSGRTSGKMMEVINSAREKCLNALKQYCMENESGIEPEAAVLTFADRYSWHIGPQPVPVQDIWYHPIYTYSSVCRAETALRGIVSVLERLDREEYFRDALPPVMILVRDGILLNDGVDLNRFRDNPWARKAAVIGMAYSCDGPYPHDYARFAKVTGDENALILTNDADRFTELFTAVPLAALRLHASQEYGGKRITGADIVRSATGG